MPGPTILRTAHGNASASGAILVAETPVLDELAPPDPRRTAEGLAIRRVRGRPFQPGNRAASGRGPSLTRITTDDRPLCDPDAPEERQRSRRKAQSLAGQRIRELEVQYGGRLSTGVRVEVVAWARDVANAERYDRAGDAAKAAALAEKASGHQLKAIGIAEREAAARPSAPVDPLAGYYILPPEAQAAPVEPTK